MQLGVPYIISNRKCLHSTDRAGRACLCSPPVPVGVGRRVHVPAHHAALSMQDATRSDIQLGWVAVQDGPQLELDLAPHLPALGLKSFKTRRFREPPDAWPCPSRPLRATLASLCRRVWREPHRLQVSTLLFAAGPLIGLLPSLGLFERRTALR